MKTIKKVLEFITKPDLKVSIKSDNIGISITKSDEDKTKIDAEFSFPNMSEDSPIEFDDIVEVNYSEKENLLSVCINTQRIQHQIQGCSQIKSHFKLWIPENSNIETELKNGGLELSELNGTFNLELKNGGINIEKCSGDFTIIQKNGKTKISNCSGTLDITCKNGPVKIIGADFSNAKVELKNGSIYYAFMPLDEGKFSFANENGKINLIVPKEIPYNITAKNVIGRFHIGLKDEYEIEKENGKKTLKMTKGSGKVKIDIQNRNGSINIVGKPNTEYHYNYSFNFPEMENIGETFKTIFTDKDGKDFEYKISKAMKVVDKIREKISEKIDSEEIQSKIKDKTNKIKEKLKDISESQVMDEISETAVEIGKEVENIFSGLGKDISDILHENTNKKADKRRKKIFKKIKIFTKKSKANSHENGQSKLKILQMLKNGKITVDEAEKLLNAIEGEE